MFCSFVLCSTHHSALMVKSLLLWEAILTVMYPEDNLAYFSGNCYFGESKILEEHKLLSETCWQQTCIQLILIHYKVWV
jgi:hypothetical protein